MSGWKTQERVKKKLISLQPNSVQQTWQLMSSNVALPNTIVQSHCVLYLI